MSKDATPPNLPHTGKPEEPREDKGPNPLEALGHIVHLLAAIARGVTSRDKPFREVCVSNTRCGSQMSAGVLRSIHNPTAGDLKVTLSDGTNAAVVVFNGVLPAGDTRPVYLAFYDGLYCTSGDGAVVGGSFNA